MKKILVAVLALTSVAFGFTSCSDDDVWNTLGNGKVEMPNSSRAFILNEGSMNKNNSNIIYFDWATGVQNTQDLFVQQNGKQLGDTGNDIEVHGNDLLVAVNVSNYVALLDGYGVEKSRVSFEQYKNLGQVRNLTYINNDVYAVSYGGYVSKLSIKGNELVYGDSLKVGDRPEDIVAQNGKLYVTLQGQNYNDNRVAVVDFSNKKVSFAEVMQDPANVYAADGKIVVRGFGAMYDNPWGVLDAATGKYQALGNASALAVNGNKAYVGNSVTDWSTYETSTTLSVVDLATGKTEEFFKNVPEEIATATVYSISVNPYDNKVYVATTDYYSDGVIYVFKADGSFEKQFSACGLNTHAIVFMN